MRGYLYHILSHTLAVVLAGKFLGVSNGQSKTELEILQIVTWFHDKGYMGLSCAS